MTPIDHLRAVLATHPRSVEYAGREWADAICAIDRTASLLPRILGHEVGARWHARVAGCTVGVLLMPDDLTASERRVLREMLWEGDGDPDRESRAKDNELDRRTA